MTLFLIGFAAGSIACPALITYNNWRVRRSEARQ